jgi:hypothetical protein
MRTLNPDCLLNETDYRTDSFDLDTLLHPARAFAHPMDVVRDRDLTLNEKRAILASWASDACAVEAAPELRLGAGGAVVRWDEIMDALRVLDREAAGNLPRRSHARWQWRRWRERPRGAGGDADRGPQLV